MACRFVQALACRGGSTATAARRVASAHVRGVGLHGGCAFAAVVYAGGGGVRWVHGVGSVPGHPPPPSPWPEATADRGQMPPSHSHLRTPLEPLVTACHSLPHRSAQTRCVAGIEEVSGRDFALVSHQLRQMGRTGVRRCTAGSTIRYQHGLRPAPHSQYQQAATAAGQSGAVRPCGVRLHHRTRLCTPVGTPCPGLMGHAIYRRVSAALIPPVDDQQG